MEEISFVYKNRLEDFETNLLTSAKGYPYTENKYYNNSRIQTVQTMYLFLVKNL